MRELITRSISGIVYVSLVVLSALFSRDVFIILFCAFAFICLLELMPMIRLRQWFIYPILPIAYYFLVWKSVSMEFIYLLLIATLLVNIYLIRDLVLVDRIALFNTKKHIIALLYLIGSSLFLALIPDVVAKTNFVQDSFQEELIIGIFVIIWTNDSFAYLFGKNFGKHKLMKRISPKKTIEGFIGGLVMAIAAGAGLFFYLESIGIINYSVWDWMIIAFVVAFFGTIGDLIQSKIKRQAEVKDSGSIMPGHGGIFDRMDSIIFAAPFAYATFLIINYVS
ncbi:phosphatidate cytidylyltransferase [Nonlabens sp. Ci31]|jgi:phosphatidate cytidylyltransferase|uniref:phosphatidate cytidylyltransferase n=1 Tax=Nonlabens sp. Ci31 TaxID=2608253 RepID=UPI001463FC66|nr:phosphatidate cytidylyltransferase [Nonlabens sp. Ci31]QJP34449.1 phosphatidate cytidylyltransferase [Nonlabens sp. Ci31]